MPDTATLFSPKLALAARWRALPDRRRVAAIAIVLLVHMLLLLAFLRLGVFSGGPPGPRAITAFNIADNKPAAKAQAQKQKSTAKAKPQSAITPPPPPPVPQQWVVGDPALRQFNLAETPSTAPAPAQQSAEASSGPADSPAVGTGPNGQTLYAAEWVREPTDQELSYYIGQRARGGYYAIIACRTVARYKVEDCVPITERPQGSGLARSIVNAAWQFLVRPPRLDGKLKVGEWVSIRIDIREEKAG